MTDWTPGATVVDRYVLRELLGSGGLSSVYRARDTQFDEDVALKIYRDATDPRFRELFEAEARVLRELNYPNIVRLFDAFVEDDDAVLVFEFLSGRTLAQWLRERRPDDADAVLDVVREVAEALGHAHERGILHRDVKPSNIFIRTDGAAVLMDFGVARPLTSREPLYTGTVIGTPAYMSPEQISDARLGPSSDVYSLGVVLYEVLAGRQPFIGATVSDVLLQQSSAPPPPLHEFAPNISPALANVALKALAKDPNDRYQSAGEFIAALDAARPARVAARPAPSASTVYHPSPPLPTPTQSSARPLPRRLASMRLFVPIVIGLALLGLLALLALLPRNLGSPSGSYPLAPPQNVPWSIAAVVGLALLVGLLTVGLVQRRRATPAQPTSEAYGDESTVVGYAYARELATVRKEASAASVAWLLVMSGPQRGQHLRLSGDDTIGRGVGDGWASVAFEDYALSRQHAQLNFADNQWFIEDLGSRNGTRVNGISVVERLPLHDRDEIVVGDTVLSFVLGASTGRLGYESQRRLEDFEALWDGLVGSASGDQ